MSPHGDHRIHAWDVPVCKHRPAPAIAAPVARKEALMVCVPFVVALLALFASLTPSGPAARVEAESLALPPATGPLMSCHSAPADDDDATLVQGRWRVVSAKHNGGTVPKDRVERMFVVVAKDELRVVVEGTKAEQAARFTLDPKQDPKQIDFTETRDMDWSDQLHLKLFRRYRWADGKIVPAEGKAEGIYKLDGDSLTLCWRTTVAKDLVAGNQQVSEARVRPGVFQSHLYYHQFLFVLERVRPDR